MIKTLIQNKYLAALSLILISLFGLAMFQPVIAQTEEAERDICEKIQGGTYDNGECTDTPDDRDISEIFKFITNTLLFLIGAVAVIMLIIGGFRYVVSAGDANAVTGAKNTILYAIVGIVVAFLSYAAVNFVLFRL